MKRSFDNTAKTEQDDSKRLKTNNEASPSQTGDGSSSSRAVVFRSDFSSDVFTPNQNVWSTSCDNQNPRHATWNRFVPIRPGDKDFGEFDMSLHINDIVLDRRPI